ncbi:MAG: hypothetical protein AAGF25_05795 [Pseudomonadota bacterium]
MKKLVTALIVSILATNTAFAGVSFTRADKNGDGMVSGGELVRSSLNLNKFAKADLNGDRKWTPSEFQTVRQPLVNPNTQDDD